MISLAGRQFKSPGPVASAFMADRQHRVRDILGPVGGGKTVTCMHDLLANAALMPVCKDGLIHFRGVAIRDTYDRLEKTTIATWVQWVPKDLGEWTGGGGRAASHKLNFEVQRGGRTYRIAFEMLFAAVGDQAAEDFARGFEVTACWLNEKDRLSRDLPTHMLGRIGRYPSVDMLPPGVTYRDFMIGDLNAPDIDDWFYLDCEENPPEGYKLYKQPSGRSPRAENLHNLKPGYYEGLLEANKNNPKWIKRFVDAQYGPSDDGEPVYPEYSDDLHLAREPIRPIKNLPLLIGVDAGLQRPAAVICQMRPTGQWLVLGEVVPGRCGSQRFCEALKLEIAALAQLAGVPRLEIEAIYSDPAGFTGADREGGELAWSDRVMMEMQHPVMATDTNELEPRFSAVRDELTYMIDGMTPALLVSPRAKMIRKGFASHYRYQKQQVGNGTRTSDKPEKNDFSHPHDALQYVMLGKKGRYSVTSNTRAGRSDRDRARSSAPSSCAAVRDGGWNW